MFKITARLIARQIFVATADKLLTFEVARAITSEYGVSVSKGE